MFDNVCKFLSETFPEDFATWLLGEPIRLTRLSPTELSLEPIRADSLILLQSDELVLHTEFQTRPDENMGFRSLDYRLRIYRRFPAKRTRQVVVYLKPTDSEWVYRDRFEMENTIHRFEVIRLWEQPTENFFHSIGLLPFAVLSRTDEPTMVMGRVARAIEAIDDRGVRSHLAAASSILAGLVLEKEIVQRVFRSEIMRESSIYQQILAEGEEKGKEEGEERGKIQGKVEVAMNLLSDGLTVERVSRLTGLSIELIQELSHSLNGG